MHDQEATKTIGDVSFMLYLGCRSHGARSARWLSPPSLSLSLSLSLPPSLPPSIDPGKLRQLDKFKEWLKRKELRLGIQAEG